VGLPELPLDEVPEGGYRLATCACEDPQVEVLVEAQAMRGPPSVIYAEGFGCRFRIRLDPDRDAGAGTQDD